ncbi:hypothetical protein BU24DRAFT_449430 [Aaosphaeria arxii CBS 175.79]|uniref:TRP C-terminal domain-containing protein n=1 Tax=Aaosphaeria arxii CBS 175.79 TaxID=1450172 RepID=A0A6A5XWX8_9PLEO|nr:uncharacterized protein BU24DRAFT_449430 [Aaosphaeria arxii CBS 175.79]KAF2017845.1 hypothetical protein BU24DRAFT_449430 [Aaosphaeria arxii CBS 175.79]
MFKPKTALEWSLLAVTSVQALVVTVCNIIILISYLHWVNPVVYQVPLSYNIPMCLTTSALGCIFQVFLTLDSFRIKNTVQLVALCIANVFLTIAIGLQYHTSKASVGRILINTDMYGFPFAQAEIPFWANSAPTLIVCIVVACVCTSAMVGLAYGLHIEFAWALYKNVSPDMKMRNRYLVYQIYLVLLRFTFLFAVLLILLFDLVEVHYREPEFSLTMGVIPLTLLHAIASAFCVQRETKLGMAVIITLQLALLAFLSRCLKQLLKIGFVQSVTMQNETVLFALVALFFAAATLVVAVLCVCNFGKGLRPILRAGVDVRRENGNAWYKAAMTKDEEEEERERGAKRDGRYYSLTSSCGGRSMGCRFELD